MTTTKTLTVVLALSAFALAAIAGCSNSQPTEKGSPPSVAIASQKPAPPGAATTKTAASDVGKMAAKPAGKMAAKTDSKMAAKTDSKMADKTAAPAASATAAN